VRSRLYRLSRAVPFPGRLPKWPRRGHSIEGGHYPAGLWLRCATGRKLNTGTRLKTSSGKPRAIWFQRPEASCEFPRRNVQTPDFITPKHANRFPAAPLARRCHSRGTVRSLPSRDPMKTRSKSSARSPNKMAPGMRGYTTSKMHSIRQRLGDFPASGGAAAAVMILMQGLRFARDA